MDDNLYLEIRTPDAEIFRGSITQVVLPGKEGLFGVLKNHAPLIATLTQGEVKVDALNVDFAKSENDDEAENNRQYKFTLKGGVVEVLDNRVMVLAS